MPFISDFESGTDFQKEQLIENNKDGKSSFIEIIPTILPWSKSD